MLYCNKHSKSLHREGFVKITSHAIISKLKLSVFLLRFTPTGVGKALLRVMR